MADETKFYEVTVTTKDAQGRTGTTHGEFETAEADPQKVAHIVSDAMVKQHGNAKYREIDDKH